MDSGLGPSGRPGMTAVGDGGPAGHPQRNAPPPGPSLPYEGREDEVRQRRDFALVQAGRVRIGRDVLAELLGGEAVAVLGVVGIFIEMRHFGTGPAAGDHLDQLLAVEPGPVQIRGLARRAWIAAAVAVHAMAELAVRLVAIQTLAE